jgi:hypothetical protein
MIWSTLFQFFTMLFLDFDSTGAGVVAETKVAETISLSPPPTF